MNPSGEAALERGMPAWLDSVQNKAWGLLAFLGAHAALGVLMRVMPGVSMVHVAATVVAGIGYCLLRRSPQNWIFLAGYVVAAEVLWKMTRGAVFWEQGKYILVLILVLALVTTKRVGNITAIAQFALLLPSSVITVLMLPLDLAKDALSFNMSGPLSLCIAAVFFATVQMTAQQLQRLLIIMLGPLFAIAALTVYNILTVPIEFEFKNSSNYFVTGGFGPNQVSAALGLGILVCFLLLMDGSFPTLSRLALGGALLLMLSQSAFTFSRNGIYCGVGAGALAIPFLVTNPKARTRMLVALPLVGALFGFVIFPRIDDFTGGKLTERFEQTSGSGREDILSAELEIWKSNPVFGVGPGVGRYTRGDVWEAAAHTEFSRLLAEHGTFGFLSMLLYPVLLLTAFLDARSGLQRAVVIASISWAMSFMLVNAMRMAAPSFMFGLAFARILVPSPAKSRSKNRNVRPASLRLPSLGATALPDPLRYQ